MAAHPTPEAHRELERLAAELGQIGFALPGTVLERRTRCGKTGCRCTAEPPQLHGPYIQWTRKVAGKTVTRTLTAEQYQRYQPWFDNARRLHELVAELHALSLHTVESIEGWNPYT